MKLHTYFRSSASFRVRIALNLKQVDWTAVYVHLVKAEQRSPAYLKLNPQGLVPSLEDDDLVLTQSLAMLEYLEERFPTPAILPPAPGDRAIVRSMANLIACDIHPLNNLRVLKYLKGPLERSQQDVDEWYAHWVHEGFAALETMVEKYGNDSFCFGDQASMADICLVPQIWNARRFNVDLSDFPKLVRIDEALQTIPAFRHAAPENQKDAS